MTNSATNHGAKPRRSFLRRMIWSVVLAVFVPVSMAACYGSFPLTHAVYDINGRITNSKIVHSIVTWIFIIFPVYGIAMFVDFIILNLVEFWSGSAVHISQTYKQDDGTMVALQSSPDGRTLTMTVSREGQTIAERHFIRQVDGRTQILDENYTKVGMVTPSDQGGFLVENYVTQRSQEITRADIQSLREAVAN